MKKIDKKLSEIYSGTELIGFSQFSYSYDNFLLIIERTQEKPESILIIMRLINNEWSQIKKSDNEDFRIRAIDGYVIGSNLFICTEINSWNALQLASINISDIINNKLKQISSYVLGTLNLKDEQHQKVDPKTRFARAVITSLGPDRWLFYPRLVQGNIKSPEIIANTADAKAMFFSLNEKNSKLRKISIDNAIKPQAHIQQGERYVVFKRQKQEYSPLLGDLIVSIIDGYEQNLSSKLKIGPIINFNLIADTNDDLWIFALKEAPVGTDVIVIKKDRLEEWVLITQQSLDGEIEDLSVGIKDRIWQLIYKVEQKEGYSLQYQSWNLN